MIIAKKAFDWKIETCTNNKQMTQIYVLPVCNFDSIMQIL